MVRQLARVEIDQIKQMFEQQVKKEAIMPRGKGYNKSPIPRGTISRKGKLVDPPTEFGSMPNPLITNVKASGDDLPISRGTVTKKLNVSTGRTGPSSAGQPGQFKFTEPFVDPAAKK